MHMLSVGMQVRPRVFMSRCINLLALLLAATAFADSDKNAGVTSPETGADWQAAAKGDTRIIGEIAPSLVKLAFDADGRQDLVAVVTGPVGEAPYVSENAFSYGAESSSNRRCLLVALHPTEKRTAREGRQVLCGQSPILVLRDDVGPGQMGRLVKKAQRAHTNRKLPKHIRDRALGDALILQTEAGESVLYLSKAGFKWEELPGGE